MPNLGKGTECIKILLSQASDDNHEPFVPMFFPVLGAHISGAEFQYPDNSWKEPTGMMANLVANSGDNKGQLAPLVEAICRDFRQHDKEEENKYLAWQKLEKSRGNNQAKPVEPVVAYRFPPTDTTRPGFLKNAIALENQGGLTQYFNLPVLNLLKKKDKELLSIFNFQYSIVFRMWPDNDVPGERLFLQLKEVLPDLVRHQLPVGCKDFSDYYIKFLRPFGSKRPKVERKN
jgi:hypothetical protein